MVSAAVPAPAYCNGRYAERGFLTFMQRCLPDLSSATITDRCNAQSVRANDVTGCVCQGTADASVPCLPSKAM